MMKDTSYSKIPSNYGLCAADCPRGDTCLRRIAYDRIPVQLEVLRQAIIGKQVLPFQRESALCQRVPVYGRSLGGQCVGYVQVSSDR